MPQWYQGAGLTPDSAQHSAAQALDATYAALKAGTPARGVYLYGPVGRGKSLLINLLLETVEEEAKVAYLRVHFHAFMDDIHSQFHALGALNGRDPMDILAERLAQKAKLFCFDEFYVTNIADAMLLGRLFEALFRHGVTVCATSNWPPDELFQGGINRENFLPFIRQIKQHMEPIDLSNGPDYRQQHAANWPWVAVNPTQAQVSALWQAIPKTGCKKTLPEGVVATAHEGGALRADFKALCAAALGREHYLELVAAVRVVMLENIPQMTRDEANETLRLITLIDICYENKVALVVSATAPIVELCREGAAEGPFLRAASRLAEMQSWLPEVPQTVSDTKRAG